MADKTKSREITARAREGEGWKKRERMRTIRRLGESTGVDRSEDEVEWDKLPQYKLCHVDHALGSARVLFMADRRKAEEKGRIKKSQTGEVLHYDKDNDR